VRDVVVFNLGQDGIERSSAQSAVCMNAPNCHVNGVGRNYRRIKALIVCPALFCSSILLAPLVLDQRQLGQ
jgi:hypothetical protein